MPLIELFPNSLTFILQVKRRVDPGLTTWTTASGRRIGGRSVKQPTPPPAKRLTDTTPVFITKSGRRFHFDQKCPALARAKQVIQKTYGAVKADYQVCKTETNALNAH